MGLFKRNKKLETNSMDKGVKLITVSTPGSVNSEQFNTIRTNIQFSGIDRNIHSIMMTSSLASEGKSTVAANLAISFARQGKRTVLLDADLRRPTIKATFSINNGKGITNFLTEKNIGINDIIYKTSVQNLYVIPSGPIPPNPSELLGSKKMESLISALQNQVDIAIYDAPPILSVTDAQILSAKVDSTILVVRADKAEKDAVRKSVELINHVDGNIIGTILNDVKEASNGYYGYYGEEKKN